MSGHAVNWSALQEGEAATRIPLPTYPFQRQRFWIEPDAQAPRPVIDSLTQRAASTIGSPAPNGELIAAEMHIPTALMHGSMSARGAKPLGRTLHTSIRTAGSSFEDAIGLGNQISLQLEGAAHDVVSRGSR